MGDMPPIWGHVANSLEFGTCPLKRLGKRCPDLFQTQFLDPPFNVRYIDAARRDLQNAGDIAEVLFRPAVAIKGHLLQDDVLGRGEGNFRVFQRAEPPGSSETALVEFVTPADHDIDLQAGLRVDNIELGPGDQGPFRRVLVEIELTLGIAGFELGDIVFAELRHDIDIVGQPRLPIGDRGDRTRHKIADAVFIETPGRMPEKLMLLHGTFSLRLPPEPSDHPSQGAGPGGSLPTGSGLRSRAQTRYVVFRRASYPYRWLPSCRRGSQKPGEEGTWLTPLSSHRRGRPSIQEREGP